MTTPTQEPTADFPTAADAYSLLTRPTLEITDAELLIIIADLRRRREAFMTGKKDDNRKAAAAVKPTEASKSAATADLLAGLNLTIGGVKI